MDERGASAPLQAAHQRIAELEADSRRLRATLEELRAKMRKVGLGYRFMFDIIDKALELSKK